MSPPFISESPAGASFPSLLPATPGPDQVALISSSFQAPAPGTALPTACRLASGAPLHGHPAPGSKPPPPTPALLQSHLPGAPLGCDPGARNPPGTPAARQTTPARGGLTDEALRRRPARTGPCPWSSSSNLCVSPACARFRFPIARLEAPPPAVLWAHPPLLISAEGSGFGTPSPSLQPGFLLCLLTLRLKRSVTTALWFSC